MNIPNIDYMTTNSGTIKVTFNHERITLKYKDWTPELKECVAREVLKEYGYYLETGFTATVRGTFYAKIGKVLYNNQKCKAWVLMRAELLANKKEQV